jgi:hypothetical protein
MSYHDPSWSLTDDALTLILHAENDIAESTRLGHSRPWTRLGQLGGPQADELWRLETAILRMVSTVEAYTDAASKYYFNVLSLPLPEMPPSWPGRKKYYKKEHSIDLEACTAWGQVSAGINLRNCLAHGLGNLTEKLIKEESLGKQMAVIDVTVSGNRMHTAVGTVPQLASGCRRFILDLESRLVRKLQNQSTGDTKS